MSRLPGLNRWSLLSVVAATLLVGAAVGFALAASSSAAPDYPFATKSPPPGWNIQASWPDMTLEDLGSRAHSIVWVDVLSLSHRWEWNGVEWSAYECSVREYVLGRRGTNASSLLVVQLGGGREIYYNFPALQPGRTYLLVLSAAEAGGRFNENYIAHPAAIYPLVGDNTVELWWPAPPWSSDAPYQDAFKLVQRIRQLERGGD